MTPARSPRRPIRGFFRWLLDPYILPRPGENPLADFALGIYPKSQRRARRARMIRWAPAFLYAIVLATIISGIVSLCYDILVFAIFGYQYLWGHLQYATAAFGCILLVGISFSERIPRVVRYNINMYMMAGISPRAIIVGLSTPIMRLLHSVSALAVIAGILSSVSMLIHESGFRWWIADFLYGRPELRPVSEALRDHLLHLTAENALVVSIIVILPLECALWLLMGQALNMSVWRLPRWLRVAIVMTIPATSPLAVAFLAEELPAPLGNAAFMLMPLAALLRPVVVAAIWHRSFRHIENYGSHEESVGG